MLRNLTTTFSPNLLVGAEHFSDAGVYKLRDDLAIVQTVDFFPPLVDDPFVFGQIAAANSLSDCYAAGATPVTCLNIVAFPDEDLPIDILNEILAGGADKVREAGAVIVGGHSIRDSEIKYGLAVTGTVHPDRFLTNAGARPGDVLVLTKPIGSDVLTSAAKTGKLPPEQLAETISVMVQLNAPAARTAVEIPAHAVTDVTGFGLIGHAFEMAEASGVTVEIAASKVPLIGRTLELAAAGALTRAWKSTLENIGDGFVAEGVDETRVRVLADAQTSGGLLLAVAAADASRTSTKLAEAGVPAVEIGRVLARGARAVVLRS